MTATFTLHDIKDIDAQIHSHQFPDSPFGRFYSVKIYVEGQRDRTQINLFLKDSITDEEVSRILRGIAEKFNGMAKQVEFKIKRKESKQ